MYLYEMHQHTASCSGCGKADPRELIFALKKAGFTGVVLTDHFYHGNTGIDRDLPWREFVAGYEKAYLTAKKAGEEADVDVLFGIEEHVGKGKELLLYGITPDFLYDHPELRDGGLETVSRAVRAFGGVVVQAHPYRNRSYVVDPDENLPLEYLDGFEIYNVCNHPDENRRAAAYAASHGLLTTAGSDAHTEEFPGRAGIITSCRIKTERELAEVLKSGQYHLYINEPAENQVTDFEDRPEGGHSE